MTRSPAPLTQGDVSGECVFYSALNAVRWLWPEHFGDLEACEQLYGELVGSMKAEAVDILIEGAESGAALVVAKHVRELLALRGLWLDACLAFPAGVDHLETEDFFRLLRLDLRHGAVAVLGLDEPWDHWTVATGIGRFFVSFFDSYGPARFTRLSRRAFSIKPDPASIRLDAAATVIYSRLSERLA